MAFNFNILTMNINNRLVETRELDLFYHVSGSWHSDKVAITESLYLGDVREIDSLRTMYGKHLPMFPFFNLIANPEQHFVKIECAVLVKPKNGDPFFVESSATCIAQIGRNSYDLKSLNRTIENLLETVERNATSQTRKGMIELTMRKLIEP